MSSFRCFTFTINNPTEQDNKDLENCPFRYVIIGLEKGENGTPHYQGYMELNKKIRFNTIKKMLPRAHIEMRRGTQAQAIEYCKKEKNFKEYGDPRWQGERTDLDKVRTLALTEGMRAVTSIYEINGINTAIKFLTYNEEPREWKPKVIWICGPTGVGKSKMARELSDMNDTYTKNDGTKWWDRYDSHEYVILDDFRDSWWTITETLSLLDRYEKQVEIKGGWRQFKPRQIIVTSIKHPSECYGNTGECIQQLLRRIDEIIILPNTERSLIIVPVVPEVPRGNTEPLELLTN